MDPAQWNPANLGGQVACGAQAVSAGPLPGAYSYGHAGTSPTHGAHTSSTAGVEDPMQSMGFDEMLMWFESDPSLSGTGSLPPPPMNSGNNPGDFSFGALTDLPGPLPTTSSGGGGFEPSSSALGDPMRMEPCFADFETPSVDLPGMNFAAVDPYTNGASSSASSHQPWQAQNFNTPPQGMMQQHQQQQQQRQQQHQHHHHQQHQQQQQHHHQQQQQQANMIVPHHPAQGMGFNQLQTMQMKQPLMQQPGGAMPNIAGHADQQGAGLGNCWNTYQEDNSFMGGSPVTTGNGLMPQVHGMGGQDRQQMGMAPFRAALTGHGGAAFSGHSHMSMDMTTVPLEQLETNLVYEMNATGRRHDVLMDEMQQFGLQKMHPYPDSSFLYSQMLKTKAQRAGPQQKSRTSTKDKMNDLERQVAELQQQKQQLAEETNSLECRINIVDRMVQLRRENHAEETAQACRLDEQLELAQKMGNMQLGQGGGMLPMNRKLSNIFARNYVDETFLLMANERRVVIRRITNALLAVDSARPGTDMTTLPAAAELKAELLNLHSWYMQQQTRGGINLLQEFMLWIYNQECVKNGKDAVDAEFHTKYKRMYPQMGLNLQQKERIKLASDVYGKRRGDQASFRETYEQALLERSTTELPTMSGVEAFRDLIESEEAVQGLLACDSTMRENRVMFSIILLRKVLTFVQQARLTVTSFPLLPCVKTLAELTCSDLAAMTGVGTTKVDEDLVNQMTKPDVELKAYSPSPSPSNSRQSSAQC